MVKRHLLFVVILLLGAILAGCGAKADLKAKINHDGSVDLNYKFLLGSVIADSEDNPLSQLKTNFEEQGFNVAWVKESDMVGIRATKTVKANNVAVFGSMEGKQEQSPQVEIKRGWFRDTYTLNGDADFSKVPITKDIRGLQSNMISNSNFNFTLEVPGKSYKNNASNISQDGKILQWDLFPGQVNSLNMEVKVWDVRNIIITLIAAALISFIFIRSRKKKQVVPE